MSNIHTSFVRVFAAPGHRIGSTEAEWIASQLIGPGGSYHVPVSFRPAEDGSHADVQCGSGKGVGIVDFHDEHVGNGRYATIWGRWFDEGRDEDQIWSGDPNGPRRPCRYGFDEVRVTGERPPLAQEPWTRGPDGTWQLAVDGSYRTGNDRSAGSGPGSTPSSPMPEFRADALETPTTPNESGEELLAIEPSRLASLAEEHDGVTGVEFLWRGRIVHRIRYGIGFDGEREWQDHCADDWDNCLDAEFLRHTGQDALLLPDEVYERDRRDWEARPDRVQPVAGGPLHFGGDGTVDLDVTWHAGWPSPKHDPAPEIQSHRLNRHTIIMRQNMSAHFEAPFMFLLFGADTAVLIDTGATPEPEYFPLRRTVDAHIGQWLAEHPREDYRLIVLHTHGHGDHRAADAQFADRERTTVVSPDLPEVSEFYGFDDWPATPRELDLGGGRIIDVIPSPGHQAAAVTFYDRHTRLLLTGDTIYPGFLYVAEWEAFRETVDKLVDWCETHPVSHVLGCHVEMSSIPGQVYPRGTTYQPDEAALPMTVAQLAEVQRAVREIDGKPGAHEFEDFHIWYRV